MLLSVRNSSIFISSFRRYENVTEAWKKFCEIPEQKNLDRILLALKSFYSLTSEPETTKTEYIFKAESLADEVNDVCKVLDQDFLCIQYLVVSEKSIRTILPL